MTYSEGEQNQEGNRLPSRPEDDPAYEPHQDEELVNQFPNLVLRPEETAERLEFERKYSVIQGEAIRFREMLKHIGQARRSVHGCDKDDSVIYENARREAAWQALHDYYRDTYRLQADNYERDREWFADSLRAARETVDFVLEEYFPLRLRLCLKMDSKIGSEHDPIMLMRFCARSGSDTLSRIRRFEAQRQLTLAQMEFELRVNHGHPDTLDKTMAWFVSACERNYFVPSRSEQIMVIADLDPANANRVSQFKVVPRKSDEARPVPGAQRVVLPLDVHFVRANGREIPVYFDARVKRHVCLKLIAKRNRHHESLSDLMGAKFVFFDEDYDLMHGIKQIRHSLVRAPGSVSGEASNIRRAGLLDPSNSHSSRQYRAWKFDVRFQGMIFELNFMYLPIWINEMVAHGRDNHRLYKLDSYLKRVFPVIFPTELYGLDWRDAELRHELRSFQLAKI